MKCTSRVQGLTVTIKPGTKTMKQLPDCNIKFLDECFKVEKVDYPTASSVTAAIGAGGDKCTCGGKKQKKCKKCGCRVCGGHEDENNQVTVDYSPFSSLNDCPLLRSCVTSVTPATISSVWDCPKCQIARSGSVPSVRMMMTLSEAAKR